MTPVLRPLRFRRLWLGTGLLALALILAVALMPLRGPAPFDLSDKLLHFLSFVFLAVWFMGVFESAHAARIAVALLGYGVAIEFLQSLTAFRSAEPLDAVADLLGILAGWGLARAGLQGWGGWVERLLGVRAG